MGAPGGVTEGFVYGSRTARSRVLLRYAKPTAFT
jgi:hypothetical protein